MKKSTLITTIAMIVVVVVALSTATYAWFTSTTATYADINLNIAADQNLTVLLNGSNVYTDQALVAFTVQDFTDDADETADSTGIRSGTWVPNQTTVLSQKPSDDTSFDNCKLSGNASTFAKGVLNPTTSKVDIQSATIAMSPTLFNVTNNMQGSQNVTLKIYVGYANDDVSRYGATGIAAYVADANGTIATTEYYLPKEGAVSADTSYAQGSFDTTASATAKSSKPFADSSSKNHVGSITSGEATAAAIENAPSDIQTKLSGCAAFYTLSVSLGSFDPTESHNYLTYIWLDAGYLNDNAKGATIKVVYAFEVPTGA